jgi:WD40 repeat protein
MLLLEGHSPHHTIHFLAFTPDGRSLVSGSNDGAIMLWDLATLTGHVLFKEEHGLFWMGLSPDGQTLAWSSYHTSKLGNLATGQSQALHLSGALRFSPDGRFLAGGRGAALLDLQTSPPGIIRQTPNLEALALAFSPDGQFLAFAPSGVVGRGREPAIRMVCPATNDPQGELRGHAAHSTDLAFSPDGTTLAAACGDFLWAWDVAGGRALLRESVSGPDLSQTALFRFVAFTPDGAHLAATCGDKTVRFWDTQTWRQRAGFDWEVGPLMGLAFAADGMRAAAGSRTGKIVVWDVDL